MKMGKLEEYMMNFSKKTLENFLGNDLVETLMEWTTTEEPLTTKKKLVDMILAIHGNQIFKDKNFRKELLKRATCDEILGLREPLGENTEDLNSLIEYAHNTPWRDNAVSQYIIKLFELNQSMFEKQDDEKIVLKKVNNNNRFYELLDYQYYIKQRVLGVLNNDSVVLKKMLVQMPTGTGKTKTAMHTLVNYYLFSLKKKGLIIWMAHTTELLEQAYGTFENVWNHLGDGDINAYQIWGDRNIDFSETYIDGIAFCGIQKLMSLMKSDKKTFDKLVRNCRLIVFDEAHMAAAQETKKMVERFMEYVEHDRSLLGLTATPGRTTDVSADNKVLSNMFENRLIGIDLNIIYRMNQSELQVQNTEIEEDVIQYFQKKHVLAKVRKEQLEYQEKLSAQELRQISVVANKNGYRDFSKKALEIIGRNKSRNFAIMNRLRELHGDEKVIIVFACSVEHAKLLSAMLKLEDIENVLVLGEMGAWERQQAINRFKDKSNKTNIIINYGVLTTGFDATNINCVFITRPTQSVVLYSQMLGRGLRGTKMGGNDECLLIDMKDNLDRYNENMAFTHFENYWKA